MRFINLNQGSQEWLDWRSKGITASEIDVLFGKSLYKTRWRLWSEKLGFVEEDDIEANPYVRRGKRCEQVLRDHITSTHGLGLIPVCGEYEPFDFIKASLDGMDHHWRPWELKIPSEDNFADVKDLREESLIVKRYWMQVQMQMLCTGSNEGFLVFGLIDEDRDPPRVVDTVKIVVPKDRSLHERIIEQARQFKEELEQQKEPTKDPERDLFVPAGKDAEKWRQIAKAMRPLLQRKAELDAELEQLSDRIQEVSDPLVQVLGENKQGEFSGIRATRIKRKGSVDWKALIKTLGKDPESETLLAPHRRASATHHRFVIVGD